MKWPVPRCVAVGIRCRDGRFRWARIVQVRPPNAGKTRSANPLGPQFSWPHDDGGWTRTGTAGDKTTSLITPIARSSAQHSRSPSSRAPRRQKGSPIREPRQRKSTPRRFGAGLVSDVFAVP